jgi:positive regulator of sigma E activity
MKFIVQVLFTIVLCALLQFFLPWWTLAIGSFVVAFLFDNKSWPAFAAGFLGVGLLWLGVAGYVSVVTDSVLTTKLNQLLPINSFAITVLVGGLVGGLAALTGSLFRKL